MKLDPPFRSAQHRRHAGGAASWARSAARRRGRAGKAVEARAVAVRRAAVSRRTSSISTTSTRRRRKAAWCAQIAFGTFDNFNQVVAGVKGSLATGTELFNER